MLIIQIVLIGWIVSMGFVVEFCCSGVMVPDKLTCSPVEVLVVPVPVCCVVGVAAHPPPQPPPPHPPHHQPPPQPPPLVLVMEIEV